MRISSKHFDFSKEAVVCFTNELWMGSTKSRQETGVLVISSHQLPAITCLAEMLALNGHFTGRIIYKWGGLPDGNQPFAGYPDFKTWGALLRSSSREIS